jgi:hypothetical protein
MASVWESVATGHPESLDEAEARRALEVLVSPDLHVQLVSVPSGRQAVLAGCDLDAIISAARRLSDGDYLYVKLNPVKADLRKCAATLDHTLRRWFMIDVDAKRENSGLMASDAEHEAARLVAMRVIEDLTEQGWPAPLVIDSGNGWHLLFRVDLPNDLPTRNLCQRCLLVLAVAYKDAEGAEIDKKT